jgi:hypothetical protein
MVERSERLRTPGPRMTAHSTRSRPGERTPSVPRTAGERCQQAQPQSRDSSRGSGHFALGEPATARNFLYAKLAGIGLVLAGAPVDGLHWRQLLNGNWMATDDAGLKVLVPQLPLAHNGYIELYRNQELAVFQYEADKSSDAVVSKLAPFHSTSTADAEHRFKRGVCFWKSVRARLQRSWETQAPRRGRNTTRARSRRR